MVSRLLRYAATVLLLSGGFVGAHSAETPCCNITAIDKKTGVVTAQDATTKQLVRFKVDNAVLLNRIALNQKVSVDHQAGRVSVEAIQGRFRIVPATAGAGNRGGSRARARPRSRPPAGAPSSATDACCVITDIDAKSSLVTAHETSTGRTFTFTVSDTSVLGGLRVGQPVHAHFASRQVSLDGRKPCCQMGSAATDAKGRPPTSGTIMLPGKKGAAADQPKETGSARGGMGRGVPDESGTGEAWEPSAPAADMPSDATAEWPQDGYPQTPADSAWPSDYGFPSGTADTGYPVDSGYGAFPSEQPGMQGEQPSLDGAKSYSYGGSGEGPVQGDVPWWKQPLPEQQ